MVGSGPATTIRRPLVGSATGRVTYAAQGTDTPPLRRSWLSQAAAKTDGCSSGRREVHEDPGCLCDADGKLRPWPQPWPESTPLSSRSLSSHRRSSFKLAAREPRLWVGRWMGAVDCAGRRGAQPTQREAVGEFNSAAMELAKQCSDRPKNAGGVCQRLGHVCGCVLQQLSSRKGCRRSVVGSCTRRLQNSGRTCCGDVHVRNRSAPSRQRTQTFPGQALLGNLISSN
jgi:hypothetical protein